MTDFVKVETVDLVLNSHVEWSCDRTFFLIAVIHDRLRFVAYSMSSS